jgi:hypothetical protein
MSVVILLAKAIFPFFPGGGVLAKAGDDEEIPGTATTTVDDIKINTTSATGRINAEGLIALAVGQFIFGDEDKVPVSFLFAASKMSMVCVHVGSLRYLRLETNRTWRCSSNILKILIELTGEIDANVHYMTSLHFITVLFSSQKSWEKMCDDDYVV